MFLYDGSFQLQGLFLTILYETSFVSSFAIKTIKSRRVTQLRPTLRSNQEATELKITSHC